MKLLVVSPHRDDAAFSLGLSIEGWLRARHVVQVLNCCTQSEYAPYSDVLSLHENDRRSFVSATRKREDVAWNKLLNGRLQITDLDLLDAPLRLACGVDEVLTVAIRAGDRAVARIGGALRKFAKTADPGKIGFVLPLALGGHIDHRVAREAGVEVLAGMGLPVAFYEDLPYAARPGIAEGIAGHAESLPIECKPAFVQAAPPDAVFAAERKRRMAERYDSQIDSDTARAIGEFALRYDGRERLWANAAWRGSALGQMHVENKAEAGGMA